MNPMNSPNPPNPMMFPKKKSSNTGLIIGIIIVFLLIVGGVITGVVVYTQKNKDVEAEQFSYENCDVEAANKLYKKRVIDKYWALAPKSYYGCEPRGFKAPYVGYKNGEWINCRNRQDCYDLLKHPETFQNDPYTQYLNRPEHMYGLTKGPIADIYSKGDPQGININSINEDFTTDSLIHSNTREPYYTGIDMSNLERFTNY